MTVKKYSTAKELRAQARDRLKNRWFVAIVAFLIVSLLGASGATLQYKFGDPVSFIGEETVYEYEDTTVLELEELEQGILGADLSEDDFGEYDLAYRYADDSDHSEYIVDTIYAVLTVVLIVLIAVFAVLLLSLYNIFVGAPLTTGYSFFNLRLFRSRREVSLNFLLNGFKKSYFNSAGVAFLTGLIMLGTVLLSFLPAAVLVCVGGVLLSDVVWFIAVLALVIGIYVCGVRLVVIQLRYSMCYYLLAEHPDMKAKEALKQSKALMNGHKWRLFRLQLSFLGWIFLSLFTLGIGLLWVGPYMQAAQTAFYRELVNGGKKQSLLSGLFHTA